LKLKEENKKLKINSKTKISDMKKLKKENKEQDKELNNI